MKVYSYYENINFNYQHELLEIWKKSWEKMGFEACITNRLEAEKNILFDEFITKINNFGKELTNSDLNMYVLSCWLRWLAYGVQKEEKFYVCDYDIINHNFCPIEPNDELYLLDGDCPCIASGTPSQFNNLTKEVLSFLEDHKKQIKIEYEKLNYENKKNGRRPLPFHDQTFFEISQKIDKNFLKTKRDRFTFLSDPSKEGFSTRQLVHYNFDSCVLYCKKNNIEYKNHDVKIKVIEKYLI